MLLNVLLEYFTYKEKLQCSVGQQNMAASASGEIQGGIFIVSHLLWHEASGFAVLFEELANSSIWYRYWGNLVQNHKMRIYNVVYFLKFDFLVSLTKTLANDLEKWTIGFYFIFKCWICWLSELVSFTDFNLKNKISTRL